ncbi:NAD(P)-dependent oxidoreductase [Phycicoccus sp. BSK3Z-2]|uniref:NAD(P)-dependent oxidoreductase n=1 Tax=Phycicoccus avicenniae TaxID=2828860 RepID=A0A941DB03_9MICO|nr:NAD(P)-dependent oxidoreductase [Phycicoccus avicenniae]MBR7744806.1 NAD(P)-dependent oxidoreductase [Phycicoccus avicenniae]
MSSVGFIGLGVMGLPMAANVVEAGHPVRAYVRRPERAAEARSRGIEVVDTVRDAVSGADVVVTVLTDGPAVLEVALGQDGILAAADPGAVYVDMSTIAPSEWLRVHAAFVAEGREVVDAPVSGGESGAEAGTLSVMAGGHDRTIEAVSDVLGAMGTVVRMGDAGSGQVTKAANQMIVAGTIQLVSEALVFLEHHGVDRATAVEVLSRGLAGSTVLERKSTAMLADDVTPGFRLALHRKDLAIAEDAASSLSLPLSSAVTQVVRAAVAQGGGDDDHGTLYRHARRTNGLG